MCLLCRLLPPAFIFFPAPIPPTPFPAGRGRPRLFHARGSAPCIPGAEPGRHWRRGQTTRPPGACLLGYPPPLTLVCFFAPIPPAPFPSGEGGAQGYFMQGAPPLASPGLNPARHLHDQRFLFVYGGQCRQPRRGGTGGEELRRLRWSSPPGQVEPVPAGASQPQTPGAGIASAAGGYRPRHPGIRPFAARTAPAVQVPGG